MDCYSLTCEQWLCKALQCTAIEAQCLFNNLQVSDPELVVNVRLSDRWVDHLDFCQVMFEWNRTEPIFKPHTQAELESPEYLDTYITNPFVGCPKASQHTVDRFFKPCSETIECGVCFDTTTTAVQLHKCHHGYCRECISTWLTQGRLTCPLCNQTCTEA